MITKDEISAVGTLQKTHALKGELNMLLDVDQEYLTSGNPAIINIDGIYVPFYTESIRPKGSFSFLVKFDGIDSEEKAKALVNKTVYALRTKLKEFLEENYDEDVALYDDLLGWTVEDERYGVIGKITDIDTNTINELLLVENNEGEVIYLPFTEDFIKEVDEDSKVLRMSLPEGMIDLN